MAVNPSRQSVVLNTRPAERAAPLNAALERAGYSAVSLPLLALRPRRISAHDSLLMKRWRQGAYRAVVVVSPTAATLGLDYWHRLDEANDSEQDLNSDQPSAFIAVGDATARVLVDRGVEVLQPQQANNEGMLEMPLIASLNVGDGVLMWRGLGGRRLLVETLRQRGVEVDSIAWYERIHPDDTLGLYQQWLDGYLKVRPLSSWSPPPIVIISSGASFEHWQHLLAATSSQDIASGVTMPQLQDFHYVVLGERLASFLQDRQLRYVQVEDLDPETILVAIAEF